LSNELIVASDMFSREAFRARVTEALADVL